MRKDPTEFRERFKKWQSGEKVYEAGLPKYGGGKEGESSALLLFDFTSNPPILDFEVQNNDQPILEVLQAKQPIDSPDVSSYSKFNKYLDDTEKTATDELKAIYADPQRRKGVTPEQFFKLYSKTAGYRTRFDRGAGRSGSFLKMAGNIRQETAPVEVYASKVGNNLVYTDPNTNSRVTALSGGSPAAFDHNNNVVVLTDNGSSNSTKAHEWAHWLYNSKRLGKENPFAAGAGKKFDKPLGAAYKKWAESHGQDDQTTRDHDFLWYEGAADINGSIKYELFKQGLFNPGDPDAKIDTNTFKTWYDKKPKNRSVERYGIEDTVNFLNNTASLNTQKYDPNRLALAKYGLEKFNIPKCKDGKESGGSFPVNLIRQTLYKNVSPLGGYSIKRNIKDFGDYDPYNVSIDDIEADPNVSNEIWAEYLKIPYTKRHETGKKKMIVDSKYKPGNSKENIKYKAIKLDNSHKDRLVEDTDDLAIGKSKNSEIFADYNLGVHTVGRGVDKDKGEYRSYYDRWDLNPFNGKYEGVRIPKLEKIKDITMGIGTPLEIYDRLYLNDYYKVNPKDVAPEKGDFYGGYLPEIVIHPAKKDTSWDIYRE